MGIVRSGRRHRSRPDGSVKGEGAAAYLLARTVEGRCRGWSTGRLLAPHRRGRGRRPYGVRLGFQPSSVRRCVIGKKRPSAFPQHAFDFGDEIFALDAHLRLAVGHPLGAGFSTDFASLRAQRQILERGLRPLARSSPPSITAMAAPRCRHISADSPNFPRTHNKRPARMPALRNSSAIWKLLAASALSITVTTTNGASSPDSPRDDKVRDQARHADGKSRWPARSGR